MSVTRAAIVAEARTWIGTRWQHQQACKGAGCDCIGLVAGVARVLGIPEAERFLHDPRFRGYGPSPQLEMLRAACAEYLDDIDVAAAQAGDVLLLRFKTDPQHFAILTGPDYMVHAWMRAPGRKVVEHRIDELWRSRIVGAFAFRGVA